MPKSNGPKFGVTDTPRFTDPDAAREFLEAKRWPDGPVCPHCGVMGEAHRLEAATEAKGKRHARKGLWKCAACRKQFTVTIGTIFEDSKIPLQKWLHAIHMLCSSKKGISAHQLHRNLGVTYKSAWFMAHRIRWSMTQEPLSSKLDGIVEIDETYVGGRQRLTNYPSNDPGKKDRILGADRKPWDSKIGVAPHAGMAIVMSLVQRGGKVRSMHMERVTAETLRPVLDEYLADGAHVMTDSAAALKKSSKDGWKHDRVNHAAKEYVRYENGVTISTNGVEGYFATLKRGINGVYHHVGKQHLHRYLCESDFRYNAREVDDVDRAELALEGTEGKRLYYRDSSVPKA
jgi:transposase-like protein